MGSMLSKQTGSEGISQESYWFGVPDHLVVCAEETPDTVDPDTDTGASQKQPPSCPETGAGDGKELHQKTSLDSGDGKEVHQKTSLDPGDGKEVHRETSMEPGDGKEIDGKTSLDPGDGKRYTQTGKSRPPHANEEQLPNPGSPSAADVDSDKLGQSRNEHGDGYPKSGGSGVCNDNISTQKDNFCTQQNETDTDGHDGEKQHNKTKNVPLDSQRSGHPNQNVRGGASSETETETEVDNNGSQCGDRDSINMDESLQASSGGNKKVTSAKERNAAKVSHNLTSTDSTEEEDQPTTTRADIRRPHAQVSAQNMGHAQTGIKKMVSKEKRDNRGNDVLKTGEEKVPPARRPLGDQSSNQKTSPDDINRVSTPWLLENAHKGNSPVDKVEQETSEREGQHRAPNNNNHEQAARCKAWVADSISTDKDGKHNGVAATKPATCDQRVKVLVSSGAKVISELTVNEAPYANKRKHWVIDTLKGVLKSAPLVLGLDDQEDTQGERHGPDCCTMDVDEKPDYYQEEGDDEEDAERDDEGNYEDEVEDNVDDDEFEDGDRNEDAGVAQDEKKNEEQREQGREPEEPFSFLSEVEPQAMAARKGKVCTATEAGSHDVNAIIDDIIDDNGQSDAANQEDSQETQFPKGNHDSVETSGNGGGDRACFSRRRIQSSHAEMAKNVTDSSDRKAIKIKVRNKRGQGADANASTAEDGQSLGLSGDRHGNGGGIDSGGAVGHDGGAVDHESGGVDHDGGDIGDDDGNVENDDADCENEELQVLFDGSLLTEKEEMMAINSKYRGYGEGFGNVLPMDLEKMQDHFMKQVDYSDSGEFFSVVDILSARSNNFFASEAAEVTRCLEKNDAFCPQYGQLVTDQDYNAGRRTPRYDSADGFLQWEKSGLGRSKAWKDVKYWIEGDAKDEENVTRRPKSIMTALRSTQEVFLYDYATKEKMRDIERMFNVNKHTSYFHNNDSSNNTVKEKETNNIPRAWFYAGDGKEKHEGERHEKEERGCGYFHGDVSHRDDQPVRKESRKWHSLYVPDKASLHAHHSHSVARDSSPSRGTDKGYFSQFDTTTDMSERRETASAKEGCYTFEPIEKPPPENFYADDYSPGVGKNTAASKRTASDYFHKDTHSGYTDRYSSRLCSLSHANKNASGLKHVAPALNDDGDVPPLSTFCSKSKASGGVGFVGHSRQTAAAPARGLPPYCSDRAAEDAIGRGKRSRFHSATTNGRKSGNVTSGESDCLYSKGI